MTRQQYDRDGDGPLVDRRGGVGMALRILLLALVLIAASAAFIFFRDQLDNQIVLGVLGILAMMGIFFIVSAVIGFVEVMPQSNSDTLARRFLGSQPDGTLITDAEGRVVFANAAYGAMTGARTATEVQTLEALLSRYRESSEALYRLTNGLREGRESHEEFRLLKPLGSQTANGSGAQWYRLKARLLPDEGRGKPLHVWQISDITAERDDQERFFKELQHAIDYLDHAPAGFFSAGRKGEIYYLNATLAEWLGVDLTQFNPGSMSIADLVAGEGMALINSVQAEPGQARTETLDLDLRRVNGQSLPVRLVHRVRAARDGAPGESRSIVLARSQGEGGDQSDSVASMRFTRFFNNT
ncbi:MAG: PAS domain-containing protein, partial [Allorhizobium sp.]